MRPQSINCGNQHDDLRRLASPWICQHGFNEAAVYQLRKFGYVTLLLFSPGPLLLQ